MSTPVSEPVAPNVLVVDDTPANLQLLVGMLKDHGFKARPVPNGELALRAARASPPDLILLDITMPVMDGYEVLARLKADPATREIPVILISALSETIDKVRAFNAGGVDYVTKPFQFEEVMARVRTHLELRRQRAELIRSYDQLRELERLREDLTHMIVHDMRSPILGLQLTLEMLASPDGEDAKERLDTVRTAHRAAVGLGEIVNQILDLSRLESGRLELRRERCDLLAVISEAVDFGRMMAGSRSIEVREGPAVVVDADRDLISRVVANLLGNAVKFTASDGTVSLGARVRDGEALVEVIDNGVGIAQGDQERIFEKFGQIDGPQRRRGSGIGLAFVSMAVRAHGGKVGVSSRVGAGSTFWFTLPLTPAD